MPALEVVYRMRRGIISPHSSPSSRAGGWSRSPTPWTSRASPRDEFLEAAAAGNYDFDFLTRLGPQTSLEGYLYPATYSIRRSDTARGR